MRGIEVEDVATGQSHRLVNPRRCLAMSDGQIHYELTPQVVNFGGTESHIAGNQLGVDLLGGTIPPKQGLPHKDKNIIGNIAATRNQLEQRVRTKNAGTGRAVKQCLVGDERSGHTEHCLASCLLHEKPRTTEAHIPFRSEPDNRRLWEQCAGQCLLRQSRQAAVQRPQGVGAAVGVVFFRPCCSKSLAICATSTVTPLLRAIALAICSKLDSGLRINSTKTRTAISAGS